jgi:uncharacterized protein (AIM24 family)
MRFIMTPAAIAPSAPVTSSPDSLATFFADTLGRTRGGSAFEVVDHRLVRIEVDDFVWIKRGTVIAYQGRLRFRLEDVFQPEAIRREGGPIRSAFKREAVALARAEGRGCVYVSDDGKYNRVFRLTREPLFVASTCLLAFEPSLAHNVHLAGGVGVLAGGLFIVELSGTGFVAIAIKGDPLTLRVTPGHPVATDPTATVAWTRGLWPRLKTDLEIRSLVAHGGGEPIQMLFEGDGYVVVNAKSRFDAVRGSLVKRIGSSITKAFA